MRASVPSQHSELVRFVREHAVMEGTFQLASGRTSSYYIDGKQVTYSPQGLKLLVTAIHAELAGFGVQAIGGLEMGAIPMVAAVALDSVNSEQPIPSFIVRKKVKTHGTQKLIEGILPKGSRVAVVDDVITTGGSIIQAVDAVEANGCTAVVAITIVDRLSGATEALTARNVPYRPLLTIEDLGLSNEPAGPENLQKSAR